MRTALLLAASAVLVGVGCGSSSHASSTAGSGADAGGSHAGGDDAGGGDASPGGGTVGTVTSSDGSAGNVGGIFTAPEPWSKDVSALAKDPRSDAIIAALDASGGWGNGNKLQIDFSILVQLGDASTPRQTITAQQGSKYCYGGTDCDAVPLQMPIPTNGNTEGSTDYTCDTVHNDCHVLVVAQDEKKLYELYNATQAGSAFTALGAFVWDLTKAYPDNLRGDQCTSADAAGFPMAGLIPTADEVASGAVNHAMRFILPNGSMKAMVYVHPGTHAGSPSSTDANAPPYGVRFRLNAAFDETPYDAGEKIILKAMKTYGMLLSDGGNIALTFSDDRLNTAKWASQGITPQSFNSIGVDNFEVVDLSPEITLTDNCVRNP